jgi:hypothetical protein
VVGALALGLDVVCDGGHDVALSRSCGDELAWAISTGGSVNCLRLKPEAPWGSLLCDELPLLKAKGFEAQNDLTRSCSGPSVKGPGAFWPLPPLCRRQCKSEGATVVAQCVVVRLIPKPVALAWRQRPSCGARAAATSRSARLRISLVALIT